MPVRDSQIGLATPVKVVWSGTKQNIRHASGTVSASGDNEIISAPAASRRIVITGLVIQNESASAVTMILKAGGSDILRLLAQEQADGLSKTFHPHHRWELGSAEALTLNLSGAHQCGYSVAYYIEVVDD